MFVSSFFVPESPVTRGVIGVAAAFLGKIGEKGTDMEDWASAENKEDMR